MIDSLYVCSFSCVFFVIALSSCHDRGITDRAFERLDGMQGSRLLASMKASSPKDRDGRGEDEEWVTGCGELVEHADSVVLYDGKARKKIKEMRRCAQSSKYTERHSRRLAGARRRRWPNKSVDDRYDEFFETCPAFAAEGDSVSYGVSVAARWWGRYWTCSQEDCPDPAVESLHDSPYPYENEDWRTVGVTAELVCKVGEITGRSVRVLHDDVLIHEYDPPDRKSVV